MSSIKETKMTKPTNILRCNLTAVVSTVHPDEINELPNIELYMLCSDKIAAVVRKLERTNVADFYKDRREWYKYLTELDTLDAKIMKAFKKKIEYEVGSLQVNPDSLPLGTRSDLERIRNAFPDDLDPEFLLICSVEPLV
jgi:hypothetical protein